MIYMELQQIEDKLKTVLKPSRYRHTLGVAYTASCMAMVFDVDTERAYRAGLLHDRFIQLSILLWILSFLIIIYW